MWPIFPLGIPHVSTEDDVHNGMFIPKGSYIIANSQYVFHACYENSSLSRIFTICNSGIAHDERVYHKPCEFIPERYLPKPDGFGEPLPAAVFGYGRRYDEHRSLSSRYKLI